MQPIGKLSGERPVKEGVVAVERNDMALPAQAVLGGLDQQTVAN